MFHEKVALITGAASGIGKVTALKFAKLGASIALVDIHPEAGQALADQITGNNGSAIYFQCNIEKEGEIKKAMDQVHSTFGRLDFAYNNAGIGGEFARVENYPTDDWDKVMAINLRGVFLCMKYEIPLILKQGKGAIVNCASLLATVAYENDSAYVASKHGVLGLTKRQHSSMRRAGFGSMRSVLDLQKLR